jgi:uncharacterized protein (TIGR02001 family)
VTYNVGVVSQYRYRGIAQTKGDPALQGGVDYANANGFYAGAWGSTIKWIKDSGSDAKGPFELDLYGGYKFEAAGASFDVGYLRYEYTNNTYSKVTGVSANTDEVYGAATYGVVTAKYSYAFSDLFGTANSKGSAYYDLSANFDLGNGFTLTPHAGRQEIKNSPNSYSDFALTLGKDLGNGLSASVAAISTTAKKNTYYTSTATNYGTSKNAVVVGVKYSF